MLSRLVLLLCGLFPLEAHDWAKTYQEAGLRPIPKEEFLPPKKPMGCLVNESCNGDFVSPRDFISPRDIVPSEDFTSQKEKTSNEQTRMDENTRVEVLVFVSFSMPEASLKALFDAATKHKAVLVMRGLYENSFVKTAEKLQNMGVIADINPELFDTYGIEHVPVFVRLQHGKEVARLSGNVSLDFAVSKLEDVS